MFFQNCKFVEKGRYCNFIKDDNQKHENVDES